MTSVSEKNDIFYRRKLAKNGKNYNHNIDPGGQLQMDVLDAISASARSPSSLRSSH
jgi:thiamine biosynthesis lipoprotein ApbE